jgi:hypothetical protein
LCAIDFAGAAKEYSALHIERGFVSGHRLQAAIGALIQSIGYRGRVAPSAPRESCLARNAGPQGPLFHGGAESKSFLYKRSFLHESGFFRKLCKPCPDNLAPNCALLLLLH